MKSRRRRLLGLLALTCAAVTSYCAGSKLVAVAAGTTSLVGMCLVADQLRQPLSNPSGSRTSAAERPAVRLALILGGLGLGCLILELGLIALTLAGEAGGGRAPRWLTDLACPDEWMMRPAQVPGAAAAFYWQGQLHVQNAAGYRATGDYTLEPEAFRIAALGDSFTYGYGVAREEAYPAVLETRLSARGKVRVYNLGVPTFNSSDVLEVAHRELPRLRPHLVIYGICLNDFLPSRSRHVDDMRWQVALPAPLVAPFTDRTYVGRLLTCLYDEVLRDARIRDNFVSSALKDFNARLARFRAELKELNRICVEATGQPVLAMPFNERPGPFDGARSRLARVAQMAARDAQMDVISPESFRRANPDSVRELRVSRWEAHPSALTHRLWAESFAAAVESHPAFCRRFGGEPGPGLPGGGLNRQEDEP